MLAVWVHWNMLIFKTIFKKHPYLESPETPEITEMTENFAKVLNQTKSNISILCLGNFQIQKQ